MKPKKRRLAAVMFTDIVGYSSMMQKNEELASRRQAMEAKGAAAWKPVNRERHVSQALQAYAAMTTSAARGAVRDISRLSK